MTAFFQTEVGALVYLTLLAAFANFAFGVWAALRDGTFQLASVGAFIRKDILGRVAPIFGTLALGWAVGLVPNPPGLAAVAPALFTLAGTGLAIVYIAEIFGRILAKLRPEKLPELTPEEVAAGVQFLSADTRPRD